MSHYVKHIHISLHHTWPLKVIWDWRCFEQWTNQRGYYEEYWNIGNKIAYVGRKASSHLVTALYTPKKYYQYIAISIIKSIVNSGTYPTYYIANTCNTKLPILPQNYCIYYYYFTLFEIYGVYIIIIISITVSSLVTTHLAMQL